MGWSSPPVVAPVTDDGISVEPLADRDPMPWLVALYDANEELVSNRVVVDDPGALRDAMRDRTGQSDGRPSEIEGLEMLPLVRLVLWAHDKFIFDPDETAAFRRAHDAAAEDQATEDAGEFWERYATEELQYDPRAQSYKPLTGTGAGVQPVDELLRELELLLHAAPSTTPDQLLRLIAGTTDPDDGDHRTGTSWTMEASQRVRAYHLLTRWANAVADPRHALIAPNAPVVNYETLLGLVLVAWITEALETGQARRLLLTLYNAFIGPTAGQGFLGRIDEADRAAAITALETGYAEIAAGLAYAALDIPGWTDDIYDWQPTLQRGREFDVIMTGVLSESTVSHVTGKAVRPSDIEALLLHRVEWIDEATWWKRLAAELRLPPLILAKFNNPKVPISIEITGTIDFLHDPRILSLARHASSFKHSDAVAVLSSHGRFIFISGYPARTNIGGAGGQSCNSDEAIDIKRLREIEDQGGTLADLFHLDARPAAAS